LLQPIRFFLAATPASAHAVLTQLFLRFGRIDSWLHKSLVFLMFFNFFPHKIHLDTCLRRAALYPAELRVRTRRAGHIADNGVGAQTHADPGARALSIDRWDRGPDGGRQRYKILTKRKVSAMRDRRTLGDFVLHLKPQ